MSNIEHRIQNAEVFNIYSSTFNKVPGITRLLPRFTHLYFLLPGSHHLPVEFQIQGVVAVPIRMMQPFGIKYFQLGEFLLHPGVSPKMMVCAPTSGTSSIFCASLNFNCTTCEFQKGSRVMNFAMV